MNSSNAPLAERMRPTELSGFIGQKHLLAPGRPLHELVFNRAIHSMILWGPPGTGKTTLAKLLTEASGAHWYPMSAVLGGLANVREAIAQAQQLQPERMVLFVDEIHRFNKAQQDAFLPHVERGTITLIGATTENPSFELNGALLSRVRVYVLKSLDAGQLRKVVTTALSVEYPSCTIDEQALEMLCGFADGDARRALNTLEIATQLADDVVSLEHVETSTGSSYRRFDKRGDAFYDQISALHKSIRGSDPDAALYWFTRMIDGGCDPLYIARRLVRVTVEDVGTADPRALGLVLDSWEAFHRLGTPEGELALAQVVIYLATVPKSNSVYAAYKSALEFVKQNPSWEVPKRLRNAPTQLLKDLGHGEGYRYAHNEADAYVADEKYTPDDMPEIRFYEPSSRGIEERIGKRLEAMRRLDASAHKNRENIE